MILPILLSIACRAIDGDTLRCGSERVRLEGIDAPEMPGHCRRGRHCVTGDPVASQHSLARALQSGAIRIERIGVDHYGRTLALVRSGAMDLSCWQLRQGRAIYKAWWDDGGRVAALCPDVAR